MDNPRIDIVEDLDGHPVVSACFDLGEAEIAASAHALRATAEERFRMPSLSADEVLELRDLTALADELGEVSGGRGTVVMSPARLSIYRDALSHFVETRDEADRIREEDREPLALVRSLLLPLDGLCAEALRAALSPRPRV
ncbi:MAG: hypothetical protein ACRDL4_04525 [Thermoleophilaceae bacterium]